MVRLIEKGSMVIENFASVPIYRGFLEWEDTPNYKMEFLLAKNLGFKSPQEALGLEEKPSFPSGN